MGGSIDYSSLLIYAIGSKSRILIEVNGIQNLTGFGILNTN